MPSSLTNSISSPSSSVWLEMLLFGVSAVAYVALALPSTTSTAATAKLRQALRDGTSLNATERVCTVNERNVPTPLGHDRSQMRLLNLWHRATYVLVLLRNNGSSSSSEEDNYETTKVVVQRRSNLKDYCPGRLDPTPGGVVGYGEEYLENATRELQEEMGIDVSSSSTENKLTRLFTFPYQDEKVKVFGDFYECLYTGKVEDLILQESEVQSIQVMTLQELQQRLQSNPDDFMPDACHALQLYFQRKLDARLERRLLKGYSSGNLDHYQLRPKPAVIFFDCDDCLYFDNWTVANKITHKIEEWCVTKAGLPEGEAYQMYKKYGTALKGLLEEGYLPNTPEAIDDYLQDVHDIGVESLLQKDVPLRNMILQMDPTIPRYIFTASVRDHAQRCLKALGIDDLFDGIIDVKDCQLETKHARKSFEIAMAIAGIPPDQGESCLFVDDSLKNIHTARQMGWRSVLVGKVGRDCGTVITSEHAEQEIDRIHDFADIWPELFV